MDIIEKITNIQTEVAEVEKFIDEGELKKLQEMTQGVESDIKDIEKKILNVENDILKEKSDH